MPIRVSHRGADAFCDTPEEAAELLRLLGGDSNQSQPALQTHQQKGGDADGRWTLSRFRDFIARLTQQQSKMLEELVRSAHGKTAKDIAQIIGVNPKALGPMLAAMSKHAKKSGVGIDDVLNNTKIEVGGERMSEFKATPSFARVAVQHGWRSE